MNASELREKSVEELKQAHLDLLDQQFKVRMKKSSGQLSQTHELGRIRRDVARVLTILKEKQGN